MWKHPSLHAAVLLLSLVLPTAWLAKGCAGAEPGSGVVTGEAEARVMGFGVSGAELWAQNCARCHSEISPARYSDAQWDVVMHHKRLRINLTGEDHRKIREFLQAAN